MLHRFTFVTFVLLAQFVLFPHRVLPATTSDDPVPAWLQQAAKSAIPNYQIKEVPAVVLHNEQSVVVGPDGLMTITTYYAVKLLTRDGKAYTGANAVYLKSSSKVREIRAWVIKNDGTPKFFGKNTILDSVSDPDDIYDEYRVKTIDASDTADVGMVFGYESVVEERPLFTQDRWEFQRRLPTLFSRYTLNLPAGWQASSVTFNHADLKPSVNGASYIWEMRDMEPIPFEPDGLSVVNLAPRIVVNYSPPNSTTQVFNSWRDVSKWYTELSASSSTLDDEIAAKARDLTENSKTEIEKIRAIAEFVQSMRYISLQIDVARGGGHRPRPATLVLQRGFGDCKDKANLMKTMLQALKIDSYLVLIYSGDPTYVRSEWASPRQFNHCIIAVKVKPETVSPTIIENEKLGRLLIFDATDPYTQLGDLPDHEQGSMALVAAGTAGDLLKMPILSPDSNRLEREADVTLTADGGVSGTISQKSFGQSAALERARLRELSATEYKSQLERWISARVKGSNLTKASPTDRRVEGKFDLSFEFNAASYAQIMQGRLMMFKPAMVGRLDQFSPVEGKRQTPIIIEPSAYSETIKVSLPDGFTVDEIPEPDSIETSYGKYTSNYKVSGGTLLFTRSLVLTRSVIPASGYDDVRKFFGVVRNAEVTPVVLMKK